MFCYQPIEIVLRMKLSSQYNAFKMADTISSDLFSSSEAPGDNGDCGRVICHFCVLSRVETLKSSSGEKKRLLSSVSLFQDRSTQNGNVCYSHCCDSGYDTLYFASQRECKLEYFMFFKKLGEF